jgi:multimeric flavodoxin WrbA
MTDDAPFDGTGLRALFVNCTLTPSPGESHTQRLMDRSMSLMRRQGVAVNLVRAVDHDIAPGVQPDMSDRGFSDDAWPELMQRVLDADILVLGTPIWLGDPSSVCRRVVERLYSWSGELNDRGQSIYYGRVGGVLVTGNEDGVKHCAMNLLYSLQHLGYTIPPQADAGWLGEIGPGPSYGDDGAGLTHDFTNRNTTIMTWNLLHLARMFRDRDGIPSWGNDRTAWADGERFGWE